MQGDTTVLSIIGRRTRRSHVGLTLWMCLVAYAANPLVVGAGARWLPILAALCFATSALLVHRQSDTWRVACALGYVALGSYLLTRLADPWLLPRARDQYIVFLVMIACLLLGLIVQRRPMWVPAEHADISAKALRGIAMVHWQIPHAERPPVTAVRFRTQGPR